MTTPGPDLLGTIVAATRRTVEERRTRRSEAALRAAAGGRRPGGARFVDALASHEGPRIIAECKRRSPSRGVLRADYDPARIARGYATHGAAAVSVLTEPTFFDGALDHLDRVRAAVTLPILRKDFVVDRYQLLEAAAHGADAVLLIVAALDERTLGALLAGARDLGLAAVVEVHDRTELNRAVDAGAEVIGVNNRNLRTLEVDLGASRALIAAMPSRVVGVAESGLRTGGDLVELGHAGYRAFLIGETLMTAEDPGATLGRLIADAGRAGAWTASGRPA